MQQKAVKSKAKVLISFKMVIPFILTFSLVRVSLQSLNIVAVKFSIMSQEEQIQQTRRKIFDELTKIVDPEIGVSIMELELIDKVDIDSGKVKVDLHLTSPFCPAVFGFKIAQDVRDNIYKLSGVDGVNVNVSNHFMADAINKQVNESKYPPKPAA